MQKAAMKAVKREGCNANASLKGGVFTLSQQFFFFFLMVVTMTGVHFNSKMYKESGVIDREKCL